MSTLLFSILAIVLFVELVALVVYHQNCSDKLKQLQYSYGFEIKKAEAKIDMHKEAIARYQTKIEEAELEVASLEGSCP